MSTYIHRKQTKHLEEFSKWQRTHTQTDKDNHYLNLKQRYKSCICNKDDKGRLEDVNLIFFTYFPEYSSQQQQHKKASHLLYLTNTHFSCILNHIISKISYTHSIHKNLNLKMKQLNPSHTKSETSIRAPWLKGPRSLAQEHQYSSHHGHYKASPQHAGAWLTVWLRERGTISITVTELFTKKLYRLLSYLSSKRASSLTGINSQPQQSQNSHHTYFILCQPKVEMQSVLLFGNYLAPGWIPVFRSESFGVL